MSDVTFARTDELARDQKSNDSRAWSIVLALLGFCAVALTCVPLLRLKTYASLNYNEGWNSYRDQMAAQHVPLYGLPPTFTITNYPFLSFHIIGWLSRLTGDVTVAGRIVALVSLVAVSLLIAAVVRKLQGSWRAGAYAALFFYIWVGSYTPGNLAIDDPQMLGSAFSTFGLFAYIRSSQRLGWLAVSALAFAAAVFTKDTFIAFPLAVALDLVLARRWLLVLTWGAVGTGAALLFLLATFRLDGRFFFNHLLLTRSAAYDRAFFNIRLFVEHFFLPIGVVIGWFFRAGDFANKRLLVLMLCTTFVFALVFALGNGVGRNIFYDTMIALAIVCAVAVCNIETSIPRTRWAQPIFAALLLLPVLEGLAWTPSALAHDVASWRKIPAVAADAARGVEFLKMTAGPAICEDILLCFEARKPLVYDPYFVRDQIRAHHIPESDILAQIEAQRYGAIEIDVTSDEPISAKGRNRFSAAFMQTLLSRYRPALEAPDFTIFRPR